MREVLGALGLAWPRLLIYPGGLLALIAAWLLAHGLARVTGRAVPPLRRGDIWLMVPPLLALSMLPLPPARSFPYGLDLLAALALCGLPRVVLIARSGGLAAERLADLRRPAGAFVLGAWALAEGAGAIELSALLSAPEPAWRWGLLLGGGIGWIAGVAWLDRTGGMPSWATAPGDLGLTLIGGLPILALLAAVIAERLPDGWAGWMLPPLAAVIAVGVLLTTRWVLR
ncbi:MAG: hypothetical protein HC822_02115 [Oscillochloris sp.]|nr:hypothetical protein [Oscillochloris sp.]